MALVAFHFDHQFWMFACHCQITDTIKFSTNYMLIQQPNGRAPLIKVEEHSEDSNFSIGAKVRICTEYAENGLQVGHSNARHVLDEMTSWRPCTRARPTIAELCCRVHQRPCALPGGRQRHSLHSRSLPPLPIAPSRALLAPTLPSTMAGWPTSLSPRPRRSKPPRPQPRAPPPLPRRAAPRAHAHPSHRPPEHHRR